MLFPYKYVHHDIEKMQGYIDYIFYEIWCKAPIVHTYSYELYEGLPELKEIIQGFHYVEREPSNRFLSGIEEIFYEFIVLNPSQIDQLRNWYLANNSMERICDNDVAYLPIDYKGLRVFNSTLAQKIETFFKSLYSNDLLALKILADKIGDIRAHYDTFMATNTEGYCPFCGLHRIKSAYHSKREAYDHYIPKSLYPFNSINFSNLAPICNECNTSYKHAKDPLRSSNGDRRKTFYTYKAAPHSIEIKIDFRTNHLFDLKPADVILSYGPDILSEEIGTWRELFGIDERYAIICCEDAKDWIECVFEMWNHDENKAIDESLINQLESAKKRLYKDTNFLRVPFLEACRNLGVFDYAMTK